MAEDEAKGLRMLVFISYHTDDSKHLGDFVPAWGEALQGMADYSHLPVQFYWYQDRSQERAGVLNEQLVERLANTYLFLPVVTRHYLDGKHDFIRLELEQARLKWEHHRRPRPPAHLESQEPVYPLRVDEPDPVHDDFRWITTLTGFEANKPGHRPSHDVSDEFWEAVEHQVQIQLEQWTLDQAKQRRLQSARDASADAKAPDHESDLSEALTKLFKDVNATPPTTWPAPIRECSHSLRRGDDDLAYCLSYLAILLDEGASDAVLSSWIDTYLP